MLWPRVGYALLCVVVPAAWGLVVYAFSNRLEKYLPLRRKPKASGEEESQTLPLDYHI